MGYHTRSRPAAGGARPAPPPLAAFSRGRVNALRLRSSAACLLLLSFPRVHALAAVSTAAAAAGTATASAALASSRHDAPASRPSSTGGFAACTTLGRGGPAAGMAGCNK